jgi:hypothetical protein
MKLLCNLLGHKNQPWSDPYSGKKILWDHGRKVEESTALLHCRLCKRCGYVEVKEFDDFGL